MIGSQLEDIHLLDYINVLLKRKYLILLCFLITLTTVLLYNLVAEPIYETSSKLLIDSEKASSSITGMSMAYDKFQMQSTELQTHLDLIVSFPVLKRVYDLINVPKSGEHAISKNAKTTPLIKKILQSILEAISTVKYYIMEFIDSERQSKELLNNNPDLLNYYRVRSLKGKIEPTQVKMTNLIELKVQHKSPRMAMDIANAFAKSYIEYTRSSNFEATKVAIDWLTKQMEGMKQEISNAEKKFLAFKQKEGIFSIKGKERIHTQKIGQFTTAYGLARSKRLAISSARNELNNILKTKEYDKIAFSVFGNPLLESLHRDLVSQEIELAGLKKTFKYKHAEIIALENRIQQIRETFEQELKRTQSTLQSEYTVLEQEEQILQSSINQFESEALDLTKKEMEYTLLEREVEANNKLYDLLFNNFTDANVTQAMPATNIIFLEHASYPIRPVKPSKLLNIILGTILGLMIGIGLSFFLEYMDRSFITTNEVEQYLALPILASIPKLPQKKW